MFSLNVSSIPGKPGNTNCGRWKFEATAKNIYCKLFNRFESRVLIDSSKHPLWIKSQIKKLDHQGIDSKVVLVWKDPISYAKSCANRGRGADWAEKWIGYHQAIQDLPVAASHSSQCPVCLHNDQFAWGASSFLRTSPRSSDISPR